MKEKNHSFLIHYLVAYSLTNSYNNSIYGQNEFIKIDKTFKKLELIIKPKILTDFEIPKEWKLDIKEKPLIIGRNSNVVKTNSIPRFTFIDHEGETYNQEEVKKLENEVKIMKALVHDCILGKNNV